MCTVQPIKQIQSIQEKQPTINAQQPHTSSKQTSPQELILNICTWNIKRGLLKRELDIKDLLQKENIDILFLTETDIIIEEEEDYKI